jgi:membrane protein involved in D-alanine export
MIPYADFLYFGVLLYIAVPTVLLGIIGIRPRAWLILATAGMLAVQYWHDDTLWPGMVLPELAVLIAYGVLQLAIVSTFLLLRRRGKSAPVFYAAILLSLLPLVVAKYVPLVAPDHLIGFLGISYLTFRALDTIIGIQDGLITRVSPLAFATFLLFFPTISSGPIDRYRRFEQDWKGGRTRRQFLADLDGAVHRVFTGFLYKFIIAALVKQYWLDPLSTQHGVLPMIGYMYAYSMYLFFDFAGYSAFAIGVSYLLGIHTPENFNRPFIARNIRDFWNRWHMTLSFWFRDHVYMRFVLMAGKRKWFKSRYVPGYIGFFLSMGLMGLWHGTAAHYLVYGLYHGALLAGHDLFSRWNKQHRVWGSGPLWTGAGIVLTFHAVCFSFLIFSGHLF